MGIGIPIDFIVFIKGRILLVGLEKELLVKYMVKEGRKVEDETLSWGK